jgi:cation:H+ antiporter
MLEALIYIILGGALLYFGAEWLVSGASELAKKLGVSPTIVGVTIVAYGTSTPEAVVSVEAALSGHGEISLGNVIGSNIANIGLILGITALIRATNSDGKLMRRDLPAMVVSALLLFTVLADNLLSRSEGVLLCTAGLFYTAYVIAEARRSRAQTKAATEELIEATEEAGRIKPRTLGMMIALCIIGLALLVGGGKLFISGASALALLIGISERIIGLTVVAVGTSLPELATSVVAALRGSSEIALGNVVGSNIFNVLLCLGLTAVVMPFGLSQEAFSKDLIVMLGFTALSVVMIYSGRKVSRTGGAVLLAGYAGYIGMLAM